MSNTTSATTTTLFDVISNSLLISELTYALSLIRELGRNQALQKDNEAALQLPINAAHLKRILAANPGLQQVFEAQDEDAQLQFAAVDDIKKRNNLRSSVTQMKEIIGEGLEMAPERLPEELDAHDLRGSVAYQASRVVFFSDQPDKGYREQTKAVFGIGVNDLQRRVVVAFRGTRTPQDWVQNKHFDGIQVNNPIKNLFPDDAALPDKVYMHRGFYEYLHQNDGTPHGVFDALIPILEQYPGYSLTITGHSLGGGLASLFAIEAASRPDIPKPVVCITHAQPLVGDVRLFASTRKLQETKNLFYLRTRNCEDGVTAVPAVSQGLNFTYYHAGWELKLYDDNRSKTVRLRQSEIRIKNTCLNWKAMIKLFVLRTGMKRQKRVHCLREYLRRINKNEAEIRQLLSSMNVEHLWKAGETSSSSDM